jgi:hypothetical protein
MLKNSDAAIDVTEGKQMSAVGFSIVSVLSLGLSGYPTKELPVTVFAESSVA